jgi:hypothetical protein
LKNNSKTITKAEGGVMMPNHDDSLEKINKELQPLVENEAEDECVQQSKESGKCAYDSSKENEEYFESGGRTLPLCFTSFKLLKQNVYNVLDQKPSRHDVESKESNGLVNENYLPLCFSSFEWLK